MDWYARPSPTCGLSLCTPLKTAMAASVAHWLSWGWRKTCKALVRLFDAQPDGFKGGMSTEKYVNLTSASRATAYRELTELSELGLVLRTGQGRGTRYQSVL